MTHVLVLMAGAGHPLTPSRVDEIIAQLPEPHRSPPKWLAQNEACEIAISARSANESTAAWQSTEAMVETVKNEIVIPGRANWPLDIALIPQQQRRKKLLIADMESTTIREELIDELAARTGRGAEIAAITAQAMRGEMDFATALKARVAQFAGLDAALLDDLYNKSVSVMPGAATLVKTMRRDGAFAALVSGGFTIFTARVAAQLGFDHHRGNALEIDRGAITGQVTPPILDRAGKARALRELAEAQNLALEETLAVGDGANDLDMLKAAGLGVAFHGKPVVAASADVAIHHGDLTSLLYLQGYMRDDFAVA